MPAWFLDALSGTGLDSAPIPLWMLGKAEDFDVPAALLLPMPPNYVLARHGHPCFRFEIVVQGSLDTGDGTIATVGDVFTARPGELYGPHTAGPDGCTTIEIFSELDGMFRLLYADADGSLCEADIRRGEYPPDFMAFPDGADEVIEGLR
ncbi:MAG: hypothetical protein QOC92_2462 [Acidimicrobiaceae bacterium]